MASKSTIVSLLPFQLEEKKPGLYPPHYFIPETDTITPKTLTVSDAFHFVYLDSDRGYFRAEDSSVKVAKSVVEDFIVAQLGADEFSSPALTYYEGEWSIQDIIKNKKIDLERLKERQKRWFQNICRIADDDWERYHKHTVISSFQRAAAKLLGWTPEDHPWMSDIVEEGINHCPACGMTTSKSQIICSNCKCVLDKERFKELQFA